MGYQSFSGSRVEYRVPHFVAAAVAVIIFIQLLVIWQNDEEFSGTSTGIESDEVLADTAMRKERTYFPRKIWQTSKTGPGGFDDGDRDAIRSWTKLNQKWRYESLTQYSAESYIRDRFANEPEIVEIFTDLQDPILRADLIRYLVLLRDGGLYTDLDTKSLKPIDDWIPTEFQANTSVVVGVEYDRLVGLRWNDWTLDLQFSTWAILAKPNHPLLQCTINKVIKGLKNLALKQGKTISGVKASREEVLDTTGPALFTRAVFDVLSQSTGTNFTWMNITNMREPRLVDDILILPITAFGCGQFHSNSGHPNEETALVQHLFKGSWKADHQLEEHNHKGSEEDHEEEPQEVQGEEPPAEDPATHEEEVPPTNQAESSEALAHAVGSPEGSSEEGNMDLKKDLEGNTRQEQDEYQGLSPDKVAKVLKAATPTHRAVRQASSQSHSEGAKQDGKDKQDKGD